MINFDGPRRSGKTYKLMERANHHASIGGKVAFICVNKAMARYASDIFMRSYVNYFCVRNNQEVVHNSRGFVKFMDIESFLYGTGKDSRRIYDRVFIDEYQQVLREVFGKVEAIGGTTMKADMKFRGSPEELKEIESTMDPEIFKREFICKFEEE